MMINCFLHPQVIREKQISLTGKETHSDYQGAKHWNRLPKEAAKSTPLDIFKKMFSEKHLTEMVKVYPSYLISRGQINTCTLEILSRFMFSWFLYI